MIRLVILLLGLSLLVSCKKDEEGDVVPLFPNVIRAGVKNGLQWDTLNPNLSLTINWDSQNLYGTGADSIDIDDDGDFDLRFECSLLNQDSLHLLNGQEPNPYPYFRITSSNAYSLRTKSESVPIGMGQTTTVYWVDSLNFDDKVKNDDQWSASTLYLWRDNSGQFGVFTNGPWYTISDKKYIAFNRLNKLGWIELDASDWENITIKSIARQL